MVKAGERLGNYEVLGAADGAAQVLGSGAGGVTYRGRHVHLGTEVAVKLLVRRRNLMRKERDAFLAEARAAASLKHPHIAGVLDFGESAEGYPYYVMELCEGGSLEDYAARTGTPDEYALVQWLFEAASALAYAHRNSILHRDIKPSNLLLSRHDGAALLKLIDFGLAGFANDENDSSQVIGTPDFAAPEQLQGRARPASDVFSLGATFFRLLSGKNLSRGDARAVINERLESSGYGHLLASLAPAWRNLLGRMLEIDPAARPPDGGALSDLVRMTFTLHAGHPVAWNPASSIAGETGETRPQGFWEDRAGRPWADFWQDAGTPASVISGVSVRARRTDTGELYDIFRFENLDETAASHLMRQGDAIARQAGPLGLGRVRLEHGCLPCGGRPASRVPDFAVLRDQESARCWHVVAWPALPDANALSWTRGGHDATTAAILAAIDPIAAALDALKSAGLEGVEIHPSMLVVNPGPPLVFALPVQLPVQEAGESAMDAGGTIRGASGAGVPAKLAATVYQLLSGRTPAPAAFVNVRAYQAIPKLSEQANRFLGAAIASALGGATCRDIVRGLAQEERIPGASLSGGAARSASWRSGASMGTLGFPASASQSSRFPDSPAVSVSAPLPSVEPVVATVPADVPANKPAPPPVPVAPPVLAPQAVSGGAKPAWLAVSAVAALVAVLATGGWLLYSHFSKPAKQTAGHAVSRPKPAAKIPDAPAPEPEKTTPPAEPSSVVRVPEDVAGISEAIQRCQEGGTVEISGGPYEEALVINKSVSLVSKGSVILEDPGTGSSLLTVRGPVSVSLRDMVIRNSKREAARDVESSPPLLLATSGAALSLDGCVVEGSMGSGLAAVEKATVTLSNTRVRKHRGNGIQATVGASVAITRSEVRENGHSGIAISGVGTSAKLGGGATVAENGRHGAEAAAGATIISAGVEITGNHQVGLVVEGAGSSATLDASSVISLNIKYGAGVSDGAKLEMSGTKVEDNGNGAFVKDGAAAAFLGCEFRANGKVGVLVESGGTSVVKVDDCGFQGHSEAGVALLEGEGSITGSRFSGNSSSICFYGTAKGTAKDNELDVALIHEGEGAVLQDNNTATR